MIEVGLVGFGLAGRAFHAPVIRAVPSLHLAAILQRSGNEAAEKYPDVRIERENAVADDSFDITLRYPNSLRVVLRSSILAAAPRPRFVVLGTQGSFVKQTFDPQESNLRHGNIPVDKSWGYEPEEKWGVLTIPAGDTFEHRRIPSASCDYRDYYANVRDAILGLAKLAVTPEWSLDVMRLLELARASSQKRCTIPW